MELLAGALPLCCLQVWWRVKLRDGGSASRSSLDESQKNLPLHIHKCMGMFALHFDFFFF